VTEGVILAGGEIGVGVLVLQPERGLSLQNGLAGGAHDNPVVPRVAGEVAADFLLPAERGDVEVAVQELLGVGVLEADHRTALNRVAPLAALAKFALDPKQAVGVITRMHSSDRLLSAASAICNLMGVQLFCN